MSAKVYLDKIIVLNKCGTRFFEKTKILRSTDESIFSDSFDWKNIEYVVIRDPKSIFYSALHTEYFNIQRRGGTNSIINAIKNNIEGSGHYKKDMFEFLYEKWKIYNFKTIHVSDIQYFIKKSLNQDITLEMTDTYKNFSKTIGKEFTFNFFYEKHPNDINFFLECVDKDTFYYEKLIESSRETIF